jgi:hypothetical protein
MQVNVSQAWRTPLNQVVACVAADSRLARHKSMISGGNEWDDNSLGALVKAYNLVCYGFKYLDLLFYELKVL